MKTLVELKCTGCGANLTLEPDQEVLFCRYCGNKMLISDGNVYTFRYLDEADVKRAETERLLAMKELEREEEDLKQRKILLPLWFVFTLLLLVLGIIGAVLNNDALNSCLVFALILGIWGGLALFKPKKKRRVATADEATVSAGMLDLERKNYRVVAMHFRNAGFTNVTTLPLDDLNFLTQSVNGNVKEVFINGSNQIHPGDIYPRTANVLITYHAKASPASKTQQPTQP